MLNHDEEEILNVLLKLKTKQNSDKITGSFDDFPVKYQIYYKEILERLESKQIIKDFSDFQGENFVLTLIPSALQEITDDSSTSRSGKKTAKSALKPIDIGKRITVLERTIEHKGGADKQELKELFEEIRELCENLASNPTIQPRKTLIKRITDANIKHPWVYGEAVKIFGITMIKLMSSSSK